MGVVLTVKEYLTSRNFIKLVDIASQTSSPYYRKALKYVIDNQDKDIMKIPYKREQWLCGLIKRIENYRNEYRGLNEREVYF